MGDIRLESAVMPIDGWPGGTKKIMLMYDTRGWAIRCYSENGKKLLTMVMDERPDRDHVVSLVRESVGRSDSTKAINK